MVPYSRRYDSPYVIALLLLNFICGNIESFIAPAGRCRGVHHILPSDQGRFGDQDMLGGIDGNYLKKEERELEIRQKVEKLKALKRKGLRYDESKSLNDDIVSDKIDRMSSASMEEAEAFFKDTTTPNAQNNSVPMAEVKPVSKDLNTSEAQTISGIVEDPATQGEEDKFEEIGRKEAGETRASSLAQAAFADLSTALSGVERTSSVGGAWSPVESEAESGEDVYKPSNSGSWGVFERPKDISKTFGGGKKIGVGGYSSDPETMAKKEAESAALLAKFNKLLGPEAALEEQNKDRIEAAQTEARSLMARGICYEAAAKLEEVVPVLTYTTQFGGTVFIELGMAYEANGDAEKALKIYQKLATVNKDELVRKQAKQLQFGFEAQEFLKYESLPSETANLWGKDRNVISERAWSGQYFDKSYDMSYIGDNRMRRLTKMRDDEQLADMIKDFDEAREILMRCAAAGSKRSVFMSNRKIKQALKRIAQERGGRSGADRTTDCDDATALCGCWKLLLNADGKKIAYSNDYVQSCEFDTLRNLLQRQVPLPLNFGFMNCSGQFDLDERTWQLTSVVRKAKIGQLPVPVVTLQQPPRAQVLTVDQDLLVTMEDANVKEDRKFEVWVRG